MKNNAFKKTFYFGLITLLFFVGVITLISINVYTLTSKHDNKINEMVNSVEYQQADSIDRSYVEPVKVIDTIKPNLIVKPKTIIVNKKTDTSIVLSDTTK
jgi:hypothetical protein